LATQFITVDRDTPYLFPSSVQDYLPENHLARFVVDIVEQLDVRHLSSVYAGKGSRPYHPTMMLALLFYGYASSTFSSRRLEQSTYDSIPYRYLCANIHPNHDSINAFRKRFLNELKAIDWARQKIEARARTRYEKEVFEYEAKQEKRVRNEAETGTKARDKVPKPPEVGPKDKDQINFTDEQSRIMPSSSGGFEQSYNAQASVDIDSGLIITNHVT
jgi:transposase